MSLYTSYTEVLQSSPLIAEKCCECHCGIEPDEEYWLLTCKDGRAKVKFRTCDQCHTIRTEFLKTVFTPTQLCAELWALRAKLSYDDNYTWARMTNSLAALQRRQRHAPSTPPLPYSPTPLRGVRVVLGG